MQGQIPAHIGVPDDKIRPQAAAYRQADRDRPQLNWRKAPCRRDQAVQHLSDGLLALGADTPAGLQPRAGLPLLLDAGTAWRANDSRHATLPENSCHHIPGRYRVARGGRIGPGSGGRTPGTKKPHPLETKNKRGSIRMASHRSGPTASASRIEQSGQVAGVPDRVLAGAQIGIHVSMGRELGRIQSVVPETA